MTRQTWSAIACFIVLVLALAGFTGIGNQYDLHGPVAGFVAKITPKADFDEAEAYAHAVQRNDLPALQGLSDPAILNDTFYQAIPKLGVFFPAGTPTAVGPLNYSVSKAVSTGGNRSMATLVIEHTYADGSVCLTTTTINKLNGKVFAFYVHRLSAQDLKAMTFNPLAANGAQPVFLIVALALIAFTTFTLYRCLATPKLRWKWAWFLFITAGICAVRLVCGPVQAFQFVPIDIHWGAGGILQMPFSPTVLYVSAPVGALAFWLSGQWRASRQT